MIATAENNAAPGWLDAMTVAEMRRECRARSLGSGVEIAGWNQEQCRAALAGQPIPGRAPAAKPAPAAEPSTAAPATQAAAAARLIAQTQEEQPAHV